MANDDMPMGFIPYKNCDSVTLYKVDATVNIRRGDVVTLIAAGQASLATQSGVTASTDIVLGIAAAPAMGVDLGADTWVPVYDDPDACFIAQADASLAEAAVGSCIDWVAGTPSTGLRSIHELDASSATTGVAYPAHIFQVLGLARWKNTDGSDNASGSYAKFIVGINKAFRGPKIGDDAIVGGDMCI